MFENTDSNIQGYFLCYYIPSKKDITVLSNLLINFKNNESTNIVNELCQWAINELSKEDIKITIIVRALGSKETEANYGKALDTLGYRLSEYLKAVYKPNILKKTRFTYPLKRLELEERQPAIENTYYIHDYNFSTEDSILIIDDIYTSGATINEIIRALKVHNPKMSIFFFTLGKTSFQFDMNEKISLPYYINKRNIDLFEEALAEYF